MGATATPVTSAAAAHVSHDEGEHLTYTHLHDVLNMHVSALYVCMCCQVLYVCKALRHMHIYNYVVSEQAFEHCGQAGTMQSALLAVKYA